MSAVGIAKIDSLFWSRRIFQADRDEIIRAVGLVECHQNLSRYGPVFQRRAGWIERYGFKCEIDRVKLDYFEITFERLERNCRVAKYFLIFSVKARADRVILSVECLSTIKVGPFSLTK